MDSGAMDLFKELQELGKSKHENLLKTQLKEPSTQMLSQENQPPIEDSSSTEEDRYQVMKTLGEGGMGLVQLAHDSLLHREVALKTIKLEHLRKERLNERQQLMLWRLKQEAEITAVLEHPNIVPLYDLKKKNTGEVYFTMRKVQGETFSKILKKQKEGNNSLDREDILTIFTKVCDAVAYAHSQGVVHRDLKPDNVMVGQFGEVYVMDWGIAKRLNFSKESVHASQNQTKKEFIVSGNTEAETERDFKRQKRGFQTIGGIGTAGYMPPEQSESASNVREQADIYALGKILKQCFTYTSPLEELQEMIDFSQKFYKNQKDLKTQLEFKKAKELPEDIQAIVNKATREDWKSRYTSVKEFIEDLERYRKNMRVYARKYNFSQLIWKWVKRNQRKMILGWIFFTIFLGFWVYLRYEEHKEFILNIKQAKTEKNRGEEEKNPKLKIDYLLKGIYAINTALLASPKHIEVNQLKLELTKNLIKSACETKNFQFAEYFLGEVESLEVIEEKEKTRLKKEVADSKTELLREHQKRLEYWIYALNDPFPGMKEEALLEINKMEEPEIFERLAEEVKRGTKYFLTSPERTSKQNEYYEMMATLLGSVGNPKAGQILWESLELISEQVLRVEEGYRSVANMQYMENLTQALNTSKSAGFSGRLSELRWKMGTNSNFYTRTEMSFKKLALFDQLTNKVQTILDTDFFSRGLLKYEIKDLYGAILDYNEAIRLNPQYSKAYIARGNVKYSKGDLDGAILDFNETIRLNPQEALAYNNRGLAKKAKGDSDGGILDFNEAIRLDPQFAHTYISRGNVKYSKGDPDGAILDYNEAIRLNPLLAEAYNNRGDAKKAKGDSDGAILDFNEAIRLNPQEAFPYTNRGSVKQAKGDLDGAILDFNEAIRLNPQFANAYYNRGLAKQAKGDSDGAILDFNEAIRLNPQYANAYHYRGNVKQLKGNSDGAILDFNEAIRLDPQFAEAYYNRGWTKQVKGDIKGAIEDIENGLRIKVHKEVTTFLIELLKQEFRKEWTKKDWEGAKIMILKLKQYLPKDDPQQKQLEQKLRQLEELLNAQEKK